MIWAYLVFAVVLVAAYPEAALPVVVLSILLAPLALRWLRSSR